jgi:anti-anti-sigma factor
MDEPLRLSRAGDGTLDIVLVGPVDSVLAQAVGDRIRSAIENEPPTAVRVELSEVTFFDSAGIAVLVVTRRLACKLDAPCTMSGASPEVYEHLRLAGLVELWGIPEPGG